jgi:MFS family permease
MPVVAARIQDGEVSNQMTVEPYRRVLAIRGARPVLLVGVFGRIPVVAMGLTLTLHVVMGMKLGFLQAGLVGAASTGGAAVGAPITGRFVDRHGLRPIVAITTAAQLVFWSVAAFLPYWALVGGAFADGVLALPVFTLIRQCLAASVPAPQRRAAYALDAMLVEVSYMVGPAIAVAASTAIGSNWTMTIIGLSLVATGTALLVLNPPTRTKDENANSGIAVPRRQWLTPGLLGVFWVTLAATFVLGATELSVVGVLKAESAARWTGLVLSVWSLASLVGGFFYGVLSRAVSPLLLVGAMAVLTIPVGLIGQWQLLCLALIPSGMLCAPSLSATIDSVSRLVPAAARGEAMGLHATALTLGLAVTGPVTGAIIDDLGARWALVVMSLIGLVLVTAAAPLFRTKETIPGRPEMEAV